MPLMVRHSILGRITRREIREAGYVYRRPGHVFFSIALISKIGRAFNTRNPQDIERLSSTATEFMCRSTGSVRDILKFHLKSDSILHSRGVERNSIRIFGSKSTLEYTRYARSSAADLSQTGPPPALAMARSCKQGTCTSSRTEPHWLTRSMGPNSPKRRPNERFTIGIKGETSRARQREAFPRKARNRQSEKLRLSRSRHHLWLLTEYGSKAPSAKS
ncbi:hypothetical protein BDP81DRAFT_445051 [Colletotrichum phormii]|uniref:Uncharacterized protein n=1 Tax=Colletotrichum phormii TaxID=359342 RepID=A0AAJ0A0F0_9PEZI|nr:uncharacterized protein BDP81DRAFT_445051 [Colletotrichum phormii]KAK1654140.1 hypothetical protein BDP81DRAFT_445051 [Colletotrichum phormii]